MKHYIGTAPECARLQRIESSWNGLPTRGRHHGKRGVPDLDKTNPAIGGNGRGWCLRVNDVREHPTDGRLAYPIDPDIPPPPKNPPDVTPADITFWLQCQGAAVELTADWYPTMSITHD